MFGFSIFRMLKTPPPRPTLPYGKGRKKADTSPPPLVLPANSLRSDEEELKLLGGLSAQLLLLRCRTVSCANRLSRILVHVTVPTAPHKR